MTWFPGRALCVGHGAFGRGEVKGRHNNLTPTKHNAQHSHSCKTKRTTLASTHNTCTKQTHTCDRAKQNKTHTCTSVKTTQNTNTNTNTNTKTNTRRHTRTSQKQNNTHTCTRPSQNESHTCTRPQQTADFRSSPPLSQKNAQLHFWRDDGQKQLTENFESRHFTRKDDSHQSHPICLVWRRPRPTHTVGQAETTLILA